jgi:8-oxo-dGTP pyrophosphatase MutT (NUDIX family)
MAESRARALSEVSAGFETRIRELLGRRPGRRLESSSALPAAVLVPLFVRQDDLHVLFTKRTDSLPHHSGQVAFPGGRHDPEVDCSLLATAIREAHEEVGLQPEHVQVMGALDEIETFGTNFVITPFVALIPHPYVFHPSREEVAEIFSVPLANLRDPDARGEELREVAHGQVTVNTIRYREHVIWGATERISLNLIEVLAASDGYDRTL